MMEFEKITPHKRGKILQDAEIYEMWNALLADGFMKMVAYGIIMEKYGFASQTAVWAAINRHKKRIENGK